MSIPHNTPEERKMKHTKGPWQVLIEEEEEGFITRTVVNTARMYQLLHGKGR